MTTTTVPGTLVKDRAGLDALPVGTVLLDKDGWVLVKTDETEWESTNPWNDTEVFDTDEILGTYSVGPSDFLPAEVVA